MATLTAPQRAWAPYGAASSSGVSSVSCTAPLACAPATGASAFTWTGATINGSSVAVGDLIYGASSTSYSNLPAVAVGSVLVSSGVTTAPAWSTTPALTSATFAATDTGANAGLKLGGATKALNFQVLDQAGISSAFFSTNRTYDTAWNATGMYAARTAGDLQIDNDALSFWTFPVSSNSPTQAFGVSPTDFSIKSGLTFSPDTVKGIVGTTTANSAQAGSVGELQTCTVATGASVSLTTNTTANVCSINTLAAGDWDCTGVVDFTFGATTSYTNLTGGVSTTSATLGAQDTKFDYETAANVPTAGADAAWVIPTVRQNISSATQVFLVAQATFTVSTLKAYGTLRCRRMR